MTRRMTSGLAKKSSPAIGQAHVEPEQSESATMGHIEEKTVAEEVDGHHDDFEGEVDVFGHASECMREGV